jgi:uncharacterized protein YdhG (YjbR/CyaY superfamily)
VIDTLKDELEKYGLSRGAIRVPLDDPISKGTLRAVINCRLKAIRAKRSD